MVQISPSFAKRPLLFGHRGASAHATENTLPAFDRALRDGADALEMDVHASADGVVMVAHDADLQRVFGDARLVQALTKVELEALGVPTLAKVLSGYAVPINIDIKQREPPIEQLVVDTINAHDASDRVLLTSFHDEVVARVRVAGYRGPTGLSYREMLRLLLLPTLWLRRFRLKGVRAQVPPSTGRIRFARRGFIEKCHALGIAVDFWVINDAQQAADLCALGADGIMSDDPAIVRAACSSS